MFLEIAYALFVSQIILILLLMSPIPMRIKQFIIKFSTYASINFYTKIVLTITVAVMFGLFCENLFTVLKYTDIRHTFSDSILTTMYSNKHEIMLKLFRAQRNMYLTFFINFNWLVIYSIQKFINLINNLTSQMPPRERVEIH